MEEVKFSNCRGFVSISCFSAQLGKISAWDHNIQNLLKKAHLVIYISCILDQVLYLSEWSGKWNKPIFPRDYRVRATVCNGPNAELWLYEFNPHFLVICAVFQQNW